MSFVRVPGLKGLLYVPEASDNASKKHQCKDCYACQFCTDSRCSLCAGDNSISDRCKHDHKK